MRFDLSDEEWSVREPLMPNSRKSARPHVIVDPCCFSVNYAGTDPSLDQMRVAINFGD